MNDSNESWLWRLKSSGSTGDDAIAQLREILIQRLRKAFRDERRVDDAMLDDVVQEALVKTIRSLDQFQGRSQFTTWVTTIAIRSAYSELRRRHWKNVSLDQALADSHHTFRQLVDSAIDPGQGFAQKSMIVEMYRIIENELTEKQRKALLAELGGVPMAEIGRQMGASRNSVYKLTYDARKRLRQGLEAAGFGLADIQTA